MISMVFIDRLHVSQKAKTYRDDRYVAKEASNKCFLNTKSMLGLLERLHMAHIDNVKLRISMIFICLY